MYGRDDAGISHASHKEYVDSFQQRAALLAKYEQYRDAQMFGQQPHRNAEFATGDLYPDQAEDGPYLRRGERSDYFNDSSPFHAQNGPARGPRGLPITQQRAPDLFPYPAQAHDREYDPRDRQDTGDTYVDKFSTNEFRDHRLLHQRREEGTKRHHPGHTSMQSPDLERFEGLEHTHPDPYIRQHESSVSQEFNRPDPYRREHPSFGRTDYDRHGAYRRDHDSFDRNNARAPRLPYAQTSNFPPSFPSQKQTQSFLRHQRFDMTPLSNDLDGADIRAGRHFKDSLPPYTEAHSQSHLPPPIPRRPSNHMLPEPPPTQQHASPQSSQGPEPTIPRRQHSDQFPDFSQASFPFPTPRRQTSDHCLDQFSSRPPSYPKSLDPAVSELGRQGLPSRDPSPSPAYARSPVYPTPPDSRPPQPSPGPANGDPYASSPQQYSPPKLSPAMIRDPNPLRSPSDISPSSLTYPLTSQLKSSAPAFQPYTPPSIRKQEIQAKEDGVFSPLILKSTAPPFQPRLKSSALPFEPKTSQDKADADSPQNLALTQALPTAKVVNATAPPFEPATGGRMAVKATAAPFEPSRIDGSSGGNMISPPTESESVGLGPSTHEKTLKSSAAIFEPGRGGSGEERICDVPPDASLSVRHGSSKDMVKLAVQAAPFVPGQTKASKDAAQRKGDKLNTSAAEFRPGAGREAVNGVTEDSSYEQQDGEEEYLGEESDFPAEDGDEAPSEYFGDELFDFTGGPSSLPAAARRTVTKLGLPEGLRQHFLIRDLEKLRSLPPEDERYKELPPRYHLAFPLDDEHKPRGTTGVFGYPSVVYKVASHDDGNIYALRRYDSVRTTPKLVGAAVEHWQRISHAGILRLHKAFIHQGALFFAHDYLGGAQSVLTKFLSARTHQRLDEKLLWAFLVQLVCAIRTVHSAQAACRMIHPHYVLITSGARVRLGCCGVADVLEADSRKSLAELQREDLLHLGRLFVMLATCSVVTTQTLSAALASVAQSYSPEFHALVVHLCTQPSTVFELEPSLSRYLIDELDRQYAMVEDVEGHLSNEYEHSRLFRLSVKLNALTDRPEDELRQPWDTNNRYVLKLFRDYLFYQVDEEGHPVLDQGHIVHSLNRLDVGDPERIVLMDRDGNSMIVVSFEEIRRCLESAWLELNAAANLLLPTEELPAPDPSQSVISPPGLAAPVGVAMMPLLAYGGWQSEGYWQ